MTEKMKQIIGGVLILAIVVVLTLVINNDSDSSDYSTMDTASEVSENTESVIEESEASEDATSTEEEQESNSEEDSEDPALTNEDTADTADTADTQDADDDAEVNSSTTTVATATTQAPLVEGAWEYNVSSPECDWMGTGGCGFYHRASAPEFPYVGPPGSSGVMNPQQWGTQGEWAYNLNDGTCNWNGDGCGFFFGNTYDVYNIQGMQAFAPGIATDLIAVVGDVINPVPDEYGKVYYEVTFTWGAPDDGGSPITDYLNTTRDPFSNDLGLPMNSCTNISGNPPATTCTTQLETGVTWEFGVSVINDIGSGGYTEFISVFQDTPNLVTSFSPPYQNEEGNLWYFPFNFIAGLPNDGYWQIVVDGNPHNNQANSSGGGQRAYVDGQGQAVDMAMIMLRDASGNACSGVLFDISIRLVDRFLNPLSEIISTPISWQDLDVNPQNCP